MSTRTVTRRKAVVWSARAGAAVAVTAWAAPKFEAVAGATETGTGTGTGSTSAPPTTGPASTDPPVTTAGTGTGTAGSPCPDPDAPSCNEETTTTRPGAGRRVRCNVNPEEVRPGGTVEFSGEGWKSSSTVTIFIVGHGKLGEASVQPDGSFSRKLAIPRLAPGSYRTKVLGSDADGNEAQCFDDITVNRQGGTGTGPATTDPSNGTSGNGGSDNGSGNSASGGDDNGALPFTGSDSTNLLALGAGALIVGRLLYGVRERIAERDGAPQQI